MQSRYTLAPPAMVPCRTCQAEVGAPCRRVVRRYTAMGGYHPTRARDAQLVVDARDALRGRQR